MLQLTCSVKYVCLKNYLDMHHGEKFLLAKDENNSCDKLTVDIFHEPDVQP